MSKVRLYRAIEGSKLTNTGRMFRGITMVVAGAAMASATIAAPKKSRNPNWLLTVAASADGGHIVGNPKAAIKVVEYASYTCGHCGAFEINDAPLLRSEYIAKGNVNFEVRPFLLNALDIPVSLLAQCGAPSRHAGNHRAIMTNQKNWMANIGAVPASAQEKLETKDFAGFNMDVYRALKLDVIAKQRGLSDIAVQKCMSDMPKIEALFKVSDDAIEKHKLQGTPGFLVNGELKQDVHNLTNLRPFLDTKSN